MRKSRAERIEQQQALSREEEKRVLRKDGRGSETNLINFTVCLQLAQPSKIIQGRI